MPSDVLNVKVARLEEKVNQHTEMMEVHERKLEAQAEKNDTITRLVALFESQAQINKERYKRQEERDKQQQVQLEKFGASLENVVVTLQSISNNQESITDNQRELGERVSTIETTLSDQKIDPNKVFKGGLALVATIVVTAIVTYLISKI